MLDDPSRALLFVVMQDTVFFVLTIALFWIGISVARWLGKPVDYSLAPLGFSMPKRGYFAGVSLGFAAGFVALIASLLIAPLSAYVVEELGYSTESRVQGPFREGLASWIGENPVTALPAICSSVLFSLVHLEPVILPVLFVLAAGLCVLYWRTKSLLPCLVAHATFNSFAVLVIILMGLGALPVPV